MPSNTFNGSPTPKEASSPSLAASRRAFRPLESALFETLTFLSSSGISHFFVIHSQYHASAVSLPLCVNRIATRGIYTIAASAAAAAMQAVKEGLDSRCYDRNRNEYHLTLIYMSNMTFNPDLFRRFILSPAARRRIEGGGASA